MVDIIRWVLCTMRDLSCNVMLVKFCCVFSFSIKISYFLVPEHNIPQHNPNNDVEGWDMLAEIPGIPIEVILITANMQLSTIWVSPASTALIAAVIGQILISGYWGLWANIVSNSCRMEQILPVYIGHKYHLYQCSHPEFISFHSPCPGNLYDDPNSVQMAECEPVSCPSAATNHSLHHISHYYFLIGVLHL